MNNNHSTEHPDENELRAELEDRLLDQCLGELLGDGPDEAASRVTSIPVVRQTSPAANAAGLEAGPTARTSKRAPFVALGLSLVVVVGTIVGLGQYGPQQDAQTIARLDRDGAGLDARFDRTDFESLTLVEQRQLARQWTELSTLNRELGEGESLAQKETTLLPLYLKDDVQYFDSLGTPLLKEREVEERLVRKKEGIRDGSQPLVRNPTPRGETSYSVDGLAKTESLKSVVKAGSEAKTPSRNFGEVEVNGLALNRGGVVRESEVTRSPALRYRYYSESKAGVTHFYSQVPQGWAKADLTWDDGHRGVDNLGLDRLQKHPDSGVGPGNSGDNYAPIIENDFQLVTDTPLSTFSIDVDTASYSNMRRYLTQNNMLPPPDAVRIEELVNYFNYDYLPPDGDDPFAVHIEAAQCPWEPTNRLVQIGLKGKEIPHGDRPASNLVFLLDVSGSMKSENKLPLLKSCLKMMIDYLTENDTISIVVYASATGQVLPATTGDQKATIMEALDRLQAGGSTNGGDGIRLAYQTATEHFIKGGINRVILATDGDFNVGTTSDGELQRLIEEKAKTGVFLTTLGFGFGNLQDDKIEMLANKGNGNYAYIDTLGEGRKVLIDEMGSTLNTIAKDVKIQIEFNPLEVAAYRLIGYENRILAARDFNDDTKDAGEIGAGHTVTAFYEVVPMSEELEKLQKRRANEPREDGLGKETPAQSEVDDLEFQKPAKPTKAAKNGDMMVVKLRYKKPDGDSSELLKMNYKHDPTRLSRRSHNFRFASSVASFGMILRGSKYKGNANYDSVLELAESAIGEKSTSYRLEFVELVKKAKSLGPQEQK